MSEHEGMKITSFLRAAKRRDGAESHAMTKKKEKQQRKKARRESEAAQQELLDPQDHVPEFIYRTVKYVRKGESARLASPMMKKVVAYIQAHYIIPEDFERDHKVCDAFLLSMEPDFQDVTIIVQQFGPHSGLTFEKRLARAYCLRQLEQTAGNSSKANCPIPPICITCAVVGHAYKECPDGF